MVRSPSGVTTIMQRPVGSPSVALADEKCTPREFRSWPKALPSPSSLTRPMYAARPPKDATPERVLAADPPEASVLPPMDA